MRIMDDLQARGIIQEYQKGLYYVDVNKNKRLDENEPTIPVSDKTGRAESGGVLESIIYKSNDLQILYETRESLEKNQDVHPVILNIFTKKYLPRLKEAEDKVLLTKYEFLKKELEPAAKNIESEKAILIRKEMLSLEHMPTIATQVKSLSFSNNNIILNDGTSFFIRDWLYPQREDCFLQRSVGNAKQDIEVILNNGNKVFCSVITLSSTSNYKKITAVVVAKDCMVVVGGKAIDVFKGDTLILNDAGSVEKIEKSN